MPAIESKIKKFFTRKHSGKLSKHKSGLENRVSSIKFDLVSKMHQYSKSCLLASYKAAGRPVPRLVYSSLPKVMTRFYSKCSVIRKIKSKAVHYKP